MWEGGLSDESEVIARSCTTKGVGIMMLSEEFVASRVYAGDVRRAEHDRELVRRHREERAAGRRAQREARAIPEAAEPVAAPRTTAFEQTSEPAPEVAGDQRRELAHAGR